MAEFSLGGVFVPALLAWASAAFFVLQFLRWAFRRLGLYRLVWHRALFNLGLYFIVLYAIVAGVSRLVGP